MVSVDWASCTTWSAYSEQEYTKFDDKHNTLAAIMNRFVLFFKDCDFFHVLPI